MKKVFALIAIVGFVACNNAEVKDATADSVAAKAKADSIDAAAKAMATPIIDSTAIKAKADSIVAAAPKTAEAPKK